MERLTSRGSRRSLVLIAVLVAVMLAVSLSLVLRAVRGGTAIISAETRTEGGEGVVAFTNRGRRSGYLCGWLNVTCSDGARRSTHLCSDDVPPATTREKRVPLAAKGCAISFIGEETPVL